MSTRDLAGAVAVSFWIRTEIEGDFNLQMHSDGTGGSAFRFSISESAGRWIQITALKRRFEVPET